jgi:hypothetical protein
MILLRMGGNRLYLNTYFSIYVDIAWHGVDDYPNELSAAQGLPSPNFERSRMVARQQFHRGYASCSRNAPSPNRHAAELTRRRVDGLTDCSVA